MDARTTERTPDMTAVGVMGVEVPPGGHSLVMSPINRRRWENFKANRRGYWAFWIFLVLFVVTLFAEFLANDKPFYVHVDGKSYFPVVFTYPETEFGGEFETAADYRDPFLKKLIEDKGGTIWWPLIKYSYDTHNLNLPTPAPSPPTWMLTEAQCRPAAEKLGGTRCADLEYNWLGTDDQGRDVLARMIYGFRISVLFGLALTLISSAIGNRNWLGTDDQGRDVLARLIYGFRISVLFGLLLTILSSIVGVTAGAVQGFFGGRVDLVFQRFLEIWSSIPSLFVLIIISSVLVPGFWTLLGVLLLFHWVYLVGVVRAEFLRGRNFEYITAARALGLSDAKIMFKHLLPNAMVATLTFLPFKLSGSITALTALDFLGLGLPPGSASLGELLAQGKANLQAPWLGITAFVVLAVMLSLLIFIGEAVRDAFDPRKVVR